jgi:hypothetical protein
VPKGPGRTGERGSARRSRDLQHLREEAGPGSPSLREEELGPGPLGLREGGGWGLDPRVWGRRLGLDPRVWGRRLGLDPWV